MFKILRDIPLGPVITGLALRALTGYFSLVGYAEEGYTSVDIDMFEGLLISCKGKVGGSDLGDDCLSKLVDTFCINCYAEIITEDKAKGMKVEGRAVIEKRPHHLTGGGEMHMCDESVKTELFKSLKTVTIESSTPDKLIDYLIASAGKYPLILRMDDLDEGLSGLLLGKEHKILSACIMRKDRIFEGEEALKALEQIQRKVLGIVSYLNPQKLNHITQYSIIR